jgi:OOP family OmpA-OmpF porin
MNKKTMFLMVFTICLNTSLFSQGFLGKLKDKAANTGSDLIVKKGAEKAEKVIDGKDKKKEKSNESKNKTKQEEQVVDDEHTDNNTGITSYSKFDFVPGAHILFEENFDQDVIGEFPLRWFTNGSSEVVTIEGHTGKWLKLVAGVTLSPTMILPPNFILEYDLVLNMPFDPKANKIAPFPNWQFSLYDGGNENTKLIYNGNKLNNRLAFKTLFHQKYAEVRLQSIEKKSTKMNTNVNPSQLDNFNRYYNGGLIHVAITIQGERLRMWYNEEKVLDVPIAVPVNHNFNQIEFEAATRDDVSAFYIGNIKLSEGEPDMRSKLLDDGHFVTTAIQFDSGSDRIKPVSYGILKEIAAAIKDNSIKVKIIGHTDNVGSAESNLALSKRRAEAVKNILVTDFKIDGTVLQTDGKGAEKPVGDNKTSTGKAENRRVEFVKL